MASATDATSTLRKPSISGSPGAVCALDQRAARSAATTITGTGNRYLAFMWVLGAIITAAEQCGRLAREARQTEERIAGLLAQNRLRNEFANRRAVLVPVP